MFYSYGTIKNTVLLKTLDLSLVMGEPKNCHSQSNVSDSQPNLSQKSHLETGISMTMTISMLRIKGLKLNKNFTESLILLVKEETLLL